jgi:Holliday junction resolvase RusA-like endonuclease
VIEIPGFVIYGPPRTKKTHNRIIKIPKPGARACFACGHVEGFPKVKPSIQYEEWEAEALRQMMAIRPRLEARGVRLPIAGLVSIEAKIYREIDTGDVAGFHQAIGDFLQAAGVLVNDKQIEDWDGTRRLKDREKPRVEIYITVVEPRAVQEPLELGSVAQSSPAARRRP